MTSLSWAPNPIVGVMAGNFVAASWMGEDPLPRVALWVIASLVCVVFVGCGRIPLAVGLNWRRWRCVASRPRPLVVDCWRCVRLLCGGPNLLIRGLTAPRWCVCVRAGVELPARARPLAVLFPPVVCSFRVCCAASCLFPLTLFSCAPAWSGHLLTGHVDCECLLTASIHSFLSACLSVIPCWVWRVAPREGWPAHTDGPP
ncbi:retrotransposon hot spot (RHS) protein [Trypanosoma cruzi]|nr:retrotransposon hot spot (RHS) protein [Trypanosoma cruzi]